MILKKNKFTQTIFSLIRANDEMFKNFLQPKGLQVIHVAEK